MKDKIPINSTRIYSAIAILLNLFAYSFLADFDSTWHLQHANLGFFLHLFTLILLICVLLYSFKAKKNTYPKDSLEGKRLALANGLLFISFLIFGALAYAIIISSFIEISNGVILLWDIPILFAEFLFLSVVKNESSNS